MDLEDNDFTQTLVDVLKRYIFYIDEKDIEYDLQKQEGRDREQNRKMRNQFYMINNYSTKMEDVLKSASILII